MGNEFEWRKKRRHVDQWQEANLRTDSFGCQYCSFRLGIYLCARNGVKYNPRRAFGVVEINLAVVFIDDVTACYWYGVCTSIAGETNWLGEERFSVYCLGQSRQVHLQLRTELASSLEVRKLCAQRTALQASAYASGLCYSLFF